MSSTDSNRGGGLGALISGFRASLGDMLGGKRPDETQTLNLEVLFGLLGALARADSIVTTHETELIGQLMDELALPTAARSLALEAFERGRSKQLHVGQELFRFLQRFPKGSAEVEQLYETLLRLAAADERIRPREVEFLTEVTRTLGFAPTGLETRLRALGAKIS
jgi:hypothetical protein